MSTHSGPRRSSGRALALGLLAAGLARGPSLAPRTTADERLIVGGAALLGAAAGAVVEELAVRGGRRVPGGKLPAVAVLAGAGLAGLAWAAGKRRSAFVDGVETASAIVAAACAAEPVVRVVDRAPLLLRLLALAGLGRNLVLGASELVALQRRLAEPQDLVKASVTYDYLPTVSVGDASRVPLATLDREGRKFLGLATPAARIEEVTGASARDPIRVFVGLESAPDPEGRARLALEELERLGAFERGRILVACATGAGFVHPVPVEAEEHMSAGDVATVAIQYANRRSYRSLRAVPSGIHTYRLLLQGIAERIPGDRPELLLSGESLGAWIAAGALVELEGEPGVVRPARVLLVGPPHGAAALVQRIAGASVTTFVHVEDPVANYSGPTLLWRRPAWLPAGRAPDPRIPRGVRWLPGITFLQVLFDVKNGTAFPVEFGATGHDYRRELPALVRDAFGHDETSPQILRKIEARTQESARAQAERERAGSSRHRQARAR